VFLVVIPAAALDTGFYYWIILSLIRTTQQLTLRKQVVKLQLFKSFFVALICSGVIALIMILYQGYVRWSSTILNERKAWLLDFFWDGLFFFLLTTLAFLWRPRQNNSRYGYAEFFTEDEGDDNQIPLETINVSKRKKEENKSDEPKRNQDEKDGFEQVIMSISLPTEDKDEIDIETEQKKMD